jgi:hypothetical protein
LSPLTKLFVVLLVIVSLLESAAIVAFVNQVDDFKNQNEMLVAKSDAADAKLRSMQVETEAARADKTAAESAARAQVEAIRLSMNDLRQKEAAKDAELAKTASQAAIQTVTATSLAGTLKAAQETNTTIQAQMSELRSSNDKLATQNQQLNMQVTDLLNRYDVTERERKFLAEQLAEAKSSLEKQGAMLRDAGVSQAMVASASGRVSAPPIEGVIRTRSVSTNGLPYATISVGSADSVTPGMEFKVLSQTGEWLGVLKVESVRTGEAGGKLDGPADKLAQVRAGDKVKTQL